jgi:hypothetical protein
MEEAPMHGRFNMIQVTADGGLALKDLALLVEPVEINDANGKLLGLFVPANFERGRQLADKVGAETDWAEIERRAQSNEECFTTKQVFEHLLSLTEDEPGKAHLRSLIAEVEERDRCDSR